MFLSALLAMVITLAGTAPANAAPVPTRSDGTSNTVFFVHGFDPDGETPSSDCSDYWSSAFKHFEEPYWTGDLVTFGYYSGGEREDCTYKYNGTRGTSIETVAKALANRIYDGYSRHGRKVDVVAHSMGGLVIRAALYHVANETPDFPPYLYVEDVATLGTPHDGANDAQLALCKAAFEGQKQCSEMTQGSNFLKGLPETPSSGSDVFRTDWTVVSSSRDATVSQRSGTWVHANHKIQYSGNRTEAISHTELKDLRSGSYRSRLKHGSGAWTDWYDRSAPIDAAFLAVFRHTNT